MWAVAINNCTWNGRKEWVFLGKVNKVLEGPKLCVEGVRLFFLFQTVDSQMGNSVPYSNVGLEGINLLYTRAT